jgi:aminoglycoside phosphotransferase (APT) family kinase protein
MNPDEVDIDAPLVARLVATQFPQWGHLPLTEVRSAGTDNTIYRLGGGLAVRLPRRPGAVAEVARQQRWLPRLAPLLPLAVPVPLARGVPGPGFPFPWLVYRWLDGQNVLDEPDLDLPDAAVRLGRFVAALVPGFCCELGHRLHGVIGVPRSVHPDHDGPEHRPPSSPGGAARRAA